MPSPTSELEDDPYWYKDAVIYELHIKAFFDSDNNGIGDLNGLTQKLDYLKELGATAIWLLPFYPSPLKDDGYDIADYYNVHPDYGTMRDFRALLNASHKKGLRVITELVLNHTSDQHPWFQRARAAARGSSTRDFYVWSETPDRYKDARVIFQDFEHSNWTWDNIAGAYYWHRFYSHQPDLNFNNPQVRKAMLRVLDFWFGMGVDGVRLDAVPYLYEREGTNCENLPETYEYLRSLREHVDSRFRCRMLLAEANQWPEDAVAYFGTGDMCHMAFHFPIMPRMFMALQMEDSFPIIDILDQTPAVPDTCQWALFLRNHDELTLEMVTDEERDYMYRVYAKDPRSRINLGIRRRLAPLMDNDLRKVQLMYTLLFSLPGTPVIYYGDELGMGDNYYLGDRDGVRTPMQWNLDRNAGFSQASPQKLYLPVIIDPTYHYQSVNVETEEGNPSSLFWWIRRSIALRRRYKAFSRGSIDVLNPDNRKIFAFVREHEGQKILVAVNLSRHPQMAAIDLSRYEGLSAEEMFSRNKFANLKKTPWVLTFGPYGSYMFLLSREMGEVCVGILGEEPEITVGENWTEVFAGIAKEHLEAFVLPAYVCSCRWFGGKARRLQELRIAEIIPIGKTGSKTVLLLLNINYTDGLPDMYLLPMGYAEGPEADRITREVTHAAICRIAVGARKGVLFDAIYSDQFCQELLSMIARKRRVHAPGGELVAHPATGFEESRKGREYLLKPKILGADQSNTSIVFGDEYILKLYRHPDEGLNPDLELTKFLTERTNFPQIAALAGSLEYFNNGAESILLGVLQRFVPNKGDALGYFLDVLKIYYDSVLQNRGLQVSSIPAPSSLMGAVLDETPRDFMGLLPPGAIDMAELLGKRTGELHLALASDRSDPEFAPQKFSTLWQRSVFQSMQSRAKTVFRQLRSNLDKLPENVREEAAALVKFENLIIERQRAVSLKKIPAMKIRVHGDYHLGQVLYTGKDFVIIDFEGEPARLLSERRLKRSGLRDAAGMIRSFHYAAYLSLLRDNSMHVDDLSVLEPWADLWYRYMGGAFLRTYLSVLSGSGLVPVDQENLEVMLGAFLIDKAVYELGYELNNRPEWVMIPARGIRHLLGV